MAIQRMMRSAWDDALCKIQDSSTEKHHAEWCLIRSIHRKAPRGMVLHPQERIAPEISTIDSVLFVADALKCKRPRYIFLPGMVKSDIVPTFLFRT